MSKIIYSGLESSGKSLMLAMRAETVLFRNIRWKEKSGISRPIYTNSPFSERFTEYGKKNGINIYLWKNLDDLILVRDADIFIDEIGTYFDSRFWADLSQDVRRWIQQGAKMGIELYGAAQDFAQIDIAFRRLTSQLFHITKFIGSARPSPTKPPIKRIWGICHMVELDPKNYDENKKRFTGATLLNWFTGWFTIQRKYCELFDTRYFLEKSKTMPYKHIEKFCENPDCEFHRTLHV